MVLAEQKHFGVTRTVSSLCLKDELMVEELIVSSDTTKKVVMSFPLMNEACGQVHPWIRLTNALCAWAEERMTRDELLQVFDEEHVEYRIAMNEMYL